MDIQHFEWGVSQAETGIRLDRFLATHLPTLSRRELAELIALKAVFVNGYPARKGQHLTQGDIVGAHLHTGLSPNPKLDLVVLFADEAFVAIDKPAGMPSLVLRHSETMTVANFLAARFPETLSVGSAQREAGLVHRLDTDTSGVLIAARTSAAYTHLRTQFNQRRVYKEYRAVVEGHFQPAGAFHFFLAPRGPHRRHMQVVHNTAAQEALATYVPLQSGADWTLVQIIIETGVRHQIRAHLSALGYPIWGDRLYGSHVQKDALHLHAHVIGFRHPVSTEPVRQIRIVSPLPQIFHAIRADELGREKVL